jgi:hypothetical protein
MSSVIEAIWPLHLPCTRPGGVEAPNKISDGRKLRRSETKSRLFQGICSLDERLNREGSCKGEVRFLHRRFHFVRFFVTLWFSGDRDRGLFVGIWVPSILSLGALLLAGRKSEQCVIGRFSYWGAFVTAIVAFAV